MWLKDRNLYYDQLHHRYQNANKLRNRGIIIQWKLRIMIKKEIDIQNNGEPTFRRIYLMHALIIIAMIYKKS